MIHQNIRVRLVDPTVIKLRTNSIEIFLNR